MNIAFLTSHECEVCDFGRRFYNGEPGCLSYVKADKRVDNIVVDICPFCLGLVQYLAVESEEHAYLHIYGDEDACETVRKILLGART